MTFVVVQVPGKPVPKARPRVEGGRTHNTARTVEYEASVGWAARQAMKGRRPVTCRVGVVIDLWGASVAADVDNLAKSILDGMNKIVYADDKQVDDLHVRRHTPDGTPRAVVAVSALPADEPAAAV